MPDTQEADPFTAKEGELYSTLKTSRCSMCPQLDELDDERLASFYDAFDRPLTIHDRTIQAVLADWGIEVSLTTLRRHRGGKANVTNCRGWNEKLRSRVEPTTGDAA